MKANANDSMISQYLAFLLDGQALDSSASQLQGAISIMAAGFWVKSFFVCCVSPVPSAGISV